MRLKRPFRILLAAVVAVALLATSCGEDEDDVLQLRMASDGFMLASSAWVAKDRGFFAEENLEVEISAFGTGIEAIQAVIAKQASIGPALDFAVLNLAGAAEENMRVVAAIAAPDPGWHSLAVRNDINGPQDLRGKRIGYVQGTSEHFVTLQHLAQNGISVDEVELIPLPGLFELVGALRTDDIQASWVWLNGTQEAEDDPNLQVLGDDSNVLDTSAIYLVSATEWSDENQEIIERVIRAYAKANEVIRNETQAAAQIVADAVSGDADLFARLMPSQNTRIEFNQTMLDSFDAIAQFLIDTGKLPADFDIREFIDFRAMEKAVPGSVTADL